MTFQQALPCEVYYSMECRETQVNRKKTHKTQHLPKMIKVNRRKTNGALTLQNNAYDANTTKKLHETSRPI